MLYSLSSYPDPTPYIYATTLVRPTYTLIHLPIATPGIHLRWYQNGKVLGALPISEELLNSTNPEHIVRHGAHITVLRASVEDRDGTKTLVPEKPEDADKALVLVDIIGTRFAEPTNESILFRNHQRGEITESGLILLEAKEPLRAVTLIRSKPGIGWRGCLPRLIERDVQKLYVKYNGTDVFYDLEDLRARDA